MNGRVIALCLLLINCVAMASALPDRHAAMRNHLKQLAQRASNLLEFPSSARQHELNDLKFEIGELPRLFAVDELDGDAELLGRRRQVEMLLTTAMHGDRPVTRSKGDSLRSMLTKTHPEQGRRCADAIALPEDRVLDGFLDAAGQPDAETWLHFEPHPAGRFRVKVTGSIDATIEAYADHCPQSGTSPDAADGSHTSFQSGVALDTTKSHAWFVRVSNRGGGGALSLQAEAGVATITGRLVNERTSGDLYGSVAAYDMNGQGIAGTIRSGAYAFNVAPGTYYVRADATGFVPELYDDAPCFGGGYDLSHCAMAQAQKIVVADGETRGSIDLALNFGGRILGRVRDIQTGVAIAGAKVSLFDANGLLVDDEVADNTGRYQFVGLDSGSYYVQAKTYGYGGQLYNGHPCLGTVQQVCYPLTGDAVVVVRNQDRSDIDLALQRQASIAGYVELLGAGRSSYGTVFVVDGNGSEVMRTSYNYNGEFVAGPLPPGDYYVYAQSPGYFGRLYDGVDCLDSCASQLAQASKVTLSAPDQQANISFLLTPYPSISGHVIEDPSGLPVSAWVHVWRVGEPYYSWDRYVPTQSDGSWSIDRLVPGNYYVAAISSTHRSEIFDNQPCMPSGNGVCDTASASTISMAYGNNVSGIDFMLRHAAEIRGRISYPIVDGLDIPAWQSARLLLPDGLESYANTDSNGRYAFIGLAAGSYRVATSGYESYAEIYPDHDCVQIEASGPCSMADATPIVLAESEIRTGVDMTPVGRRLLSGRIQSTSGIPLGGVVVDEWAASDGQHYAAVSSDAQGHYRLDLSYLVEPGPNNGVFLSTDAGAAWIDQIYDGIDCAQGSAYDGRCALAGATKFVLPTFAAGASPQPLVINFVLDSEADTIFHDGFE